MLGERRSKRRYVQNERMPLKPPQTKKGVIRVEPPTTLWSWPEGADAEPFEELVGVGADLEPGTILAAYRQGLFPMPLPVEAPTTQAEIAAIGWWSPDPRGVIPLDAGPGGIKMSRSLRRSLRRYKITVDQAFDEVISACAEPNRQHGWIDDEIITAYRRLHQMGWVHSIEAWDAEDGTLAGGLYGVAINAFFAGESMFSKRRDASKVALIALVQLLRALRFQLLDVQWCTAHLKSLGAVELPRTEYLGLLSAAVSAPAELLGPLEQPWRL